MPRGQYDRKAAAEKREAAKKPRRRRVTAPKRATSSSSYLEDRVARLEAQMNALKSAL